MACRHRRSWGAEPTALISAHAATGPDRTCWTDNGAPRRVAVHGGGGNIGPICRAAGTLALTPTWDGGNR